MRPSVSGFFWSYTHVDNEYSQGRINGLAELIKKEFAIRTNTDIDIFVDRTHISWGQDWRRRIDSGLSGATFFMPVITPRYFASQECRRELLAFAGNAKGLGVEELILPILWVDTPELLEDSQDEAVTLIRRMQYEDWRRLRLEDEKSTVHLSAVFRLVSRLQEISAQVGTQPVTEANDPPPDVTEDRPTTLDTVAALEQAVPRWSEALTTMHEAENRITALTESIEDSLKAENLDMTAGAATARIKILQRYSDTIMPIADEILDIASRFASDVISQDPGILGLIRAAEDANPAEDFVEFACKIILTITPRLRQNVKVIGNFSEAMSVFLKGSRVLYPPTMKVSTATKRLADGFQRIEEWERRIEDTGRERPHLPGLDDYAPASEPDDHDDPDSPRADDNDRGL